MKFRQVLAGFALAAACVTAGSAQAVIVTFASFDAIDGSNLRWVNNGVADSGSGGSLFSIGSTGGVVPAARNVTFSFLNVGLAPEVTNVNALFTLTASAPSGNPASSLSSFLLQDGIAGTFSFVSTSAIFIGSTNTTFAAGSNLLSGSFGGASILGRGVGGSLGASTQGGDTVVFTSDFLDFSAVTDSDLSLSLTGVSPSFARLSSAALSGFTATGGGTFSSDGVADSPTAGVPEPATWALTLLGFGILGARLRQRRSGVIAR